MFHCRNTWEEAFSKKSCIHSRHVGNSNHNNAHHENASFKRLRNEKSVWNLEYLPVYIIIHIFHILRNTQWQTLGGAKFCNSGRERVSLITDSHLLIQKFYNRRIFFLKLQRLYANINPNFSDVHQKRSKNMGIGPWPHYREQPQNLDRINIKNPRKSQM